MCFLKIDMLVESTNCRSDPIFRIYRIFSVRMDLPAPRILDKPSHFRYLIYNFR